MIRKNVLGAALAALISAVVLAACSDSPAQDHNDADIAFAQGMIPHHVGALDMSKLAQGRTSNPKVLDLAARIEKAQSPEITTMTEWLKAWHAEVPGTNAPTSEHGGHGTTGHGMDPTDMAKLEQAKDAEFDKLFLDMMIKHHQGAIDMSTTELQQGRNAGAKQLAQRIIDAQRAEIEEMKGLLIAGG